MPTGYLEHEKHFISLWQKLVKDSSYNMPSRDQITDDMISDYTASLVTLDFDGHALWVTHTGPAVIEFYGHDITGMDYFSFYTDDARKDLIDLFKEMYQRPFSYFVERHFYQDDGQKLYSKTISLPFADETGQFKTVLSLTNAQTILDDKKANDQEKPAQNAIVRNVDFWDLGFGLPDQKILEKIKKLILIETIG